MQEIIVYRNPGEAALWHALTSAEFVPVICGIVVFFVAFLLANRILTGGRNFRVPARRTNTALAIGAVAGLLTIKWMWL